MHFEDGQRRPELKHSLSRVVARAGGQLVRAPPPPPFRSPRWLVAVLRFGLLRAIYERRMESVLANPPAGFPPSWRRLMSQRSLRLTSSGVSPSEEVSECLKKCIGPLAKLDRSFHYVFNHYEEVCDLLERGAFCSRKCSSEDQQKFHQYTTFYRIHCVDYEEDLEPHLPCLRSAAKDSDDVCRDRCHNSYKVEKTDEKEKKMKIGCMSLECSTVCYFQEFIAECPEAEDALLKLNIGQIHSIAQTIHPVSYEKMSEECRNIHDTDYMKRKMLGMDD